MLEREARRATGRDRWFVTSPGELSDAFFAVASGVRPLTVADDFRAKAIKCRQIADTIMDVQAIDGLTALAADYDAKADVADRRSSGTAEPPTTDAEPPLAPPDP